MALETFFDFSIYLPRKMSAVEVVKAFSLPLFSFRVIVRFFFF